MLRGNMGYAAPAPAIAQMETCRDTSLFGQYASAPPAIGFRRYAGGFILGGSRNYKGEHVIDIDNLRKYYAEDSVLISEHAAMRFRERGIKARDIRASINNGEIIEQYPEDFPYPSCLILGHSATGTPIHVVMSDNGSMGKIITAYYPSSDKWHEDLKTRKEKLI